MKLLTAKRVAVSISMTLILAVAARAQTAADATVTVTSNPPGATIMLTGDMTVAGVTPTTFTQRLAGYFKITAYRNGYETYNSSVLLSGRDATTIDFKLKPKTRIKAAVRSLFIPGWGQRYYGAKTKGSLMFIGVIVSGTAAGIMHLRFDNKRDDYYDFQKLYDAERSVPIKEAMLPELYARQKDAYDAEQDRKIAGAIVAGVWAYSVLDALLFFPDFGIEVSGANLSVAPEYDGNAVKLMGRIKF
ncbi:MAG: PEGA domain-containing protein [Candidatus Zixiibacteriota bacterium]